MKLNTLVLWVVLCVLASADYAPRRTVTTTIEVCGCTPDPASVDSDPIVTVAAVEAFTTLTCCPTCSPIPVTRTEQLITSCTTPLQSTTVICSDSGVHTYGGGLYTCSDTPCTFTYQAPCPTCYVCPFEQCWALDSEFKTKQVKVYEYVDQNLISTCEQEWSVTTSCFTKSKLFYSPTIYIENDITINVTVAPTIITFTSTSTATITQTVTGSSSPKYHSTSNGRFTQSNRSPHHSASPGANHSPGSSSGGHESPAAPASATTSTSSNPPASDPSSVPVSLIIGSGTHAGMAIVFINGMLSYSNNSPAQLRLSGVQLFDSSNNLVYISSDELQANGKSRAYNLPNRPSDSLTDIWSIDPNEGLVVSVNSTSLRLRRRGTTQLSDYTCNDDGNLYFGDVQGTCDVVSLLESNGTSPDPTSSSSTSPSTSPTSPASTNTPQPPASAPVSQSPSEPSSMPSPAPSSWPVWSNTSSGAPVSVYFSWASTTSNPPSSTGSNSTVPDPPSSTGSNSTGGSVPTPTPTTFSYTVSSQDISTGDWTDSDSISAIRITFSAGNNTVANVPLVATTDGGLLRNGNFTGTSITTSSDSWGLVSLEFSSLTIGNFTLTLFSGTQTEQVSITVSTFVAGMQAVIIGGNSTVDQGNGNTPDTIRQIQLLAYDSNSIGVPDVPVSFSCDTLDDLCVFSSTSPNLTDSNGLLTISFTSWRGGSKTVTFTYGNIATSVSLEVAQILSCTNSQFVSASNSSTPYLGYNNTAMIATVLDLNDDPIPNYSVEIIGTDFDFVYWDEILLTDANGQALLDEGQDQADDMYWSATISGCDPIQLDLDWMFPIDCGASYLVSPPPDNFTLSESDILQVDAHLALLPGASTSVFQDASVRLGGFHTGGWYYGLIVDSNGDTSYNISYYSGQPLIQNITITVLNGPSACVLSSLVTYTPPPV